jgi:hypothetical protein
MNTLLNPIHLACVADDSSPNKRLIEIKRGIATASNGIIIARIDLREQDAIPPEQLDILDGKFIDMEAWKDFHNADSVTFEHDIIHCSKNGSGKYFDYSTAQGEFFNIDSIIMTIADAGEEAKTFTQYNIRYLEILRKIFDTNSLIFAQSKGIAGTLVYPNNYSGMFGVIMPIVQTETQSRYYFLT